MGRGSEQVAFLTRTLGELSEVVGREKAEVQWLKIQLSCEQPAVKDAKARSEILRRRLCEFEENYHKTDRMFCNNLKEERSSRRRLPS